jgi:hypothetical protein
VISAMKLCIVRYQKNMRSKSPGEALGLTTEQQRKAKGA